MDWSKCPIVEIDPLRMSGVPILRGTRRPIESIIDIFLTGMPIDELSDMYEIPKDLIEELFRFIMLQNTTLAA